jgi:hypothetical protein
MDQKTSFIGNSEIFIGNEWNILSSEQLMSKLFCTFTAPDHLEDIVSTINRRYSILYNKIFILESPQSEELMCTYNIDMGNTSDVPLPSTILLHRKKESNTLYTINALNTLIKSLNDGRLDKNYIVNWNEYKNSILLTNGPDLRKLDTAIYKIIDLAAH